MLKKFFDALRGGSTGTTEAPKRQAADSVTYKDHEIVAMPDTAGGQYRVSGIIRKQRENGHVDEVRFERSDMLPDRDSCIALTRTKAERYIDEQGERLFDDPHRPA